MKRKLLLQIIIGYIVFGVIGFIAIAVLSSTILFNSITSAKASSLYKEATIISDQYLTDYYNSSSTLKDVWNNLKVVDNYIQAQIWIVNPDGEIILNSRKSLSEKSTTIEDFDPTQTGEKYYQIGTFNGYFDDDTLSVASPIVSNYKVKSYVIIHIPMDDIYEERDSISSVLYLCFLIIYLLSLIPLIVFYFKIYLPLYKINTISLEYAANNFEHKIPYNNDDELGTLSNSINYLALQLNTLEEYQRKFIANISHDFRSPLTSIKGYLEAMSDGTIPAESQKKYFNILLFETERLTKLTSSLLTLNNFESSGGHLDIIDFDINKTIKDTAASFEGTCKDKMVSIELILSGKVLFVTGDVGKIQQVLYNLIDNAIKFSHNNSTITIETTEKNEKVFISVKDTGIGIPKDSIKKVWDRFYKSDYSRGKDKKGTGLGLTIVKEIIQAHNENIDVISTEGIGTEFIFSLPKSKNR